MDYLIGHLVGDYILQNDWQAMSKKENSLHGWFTCLVHCVLYTLSVLTFTGWWRWDLAGLVFLSHFPIDKTYIVALYMKKVGAFERILGMPQVHREDINQNGLLASLYSLTDWSITNHKVWAYLFVDNTVHLTLLWLIAKFAV